MTTLFVDQRLEEHEEHNDHKNNRKTKQRLNSEIKRHNLDYFGAYALITTNVNPRSNNGYETHNKIVVPEKAKINLGFGFEPRTTNQANPQYKNLRTSWLHNL